MTMPYTAEQLARAWIDGWNAGKPEDIPLASNFTHSSPFGIIQGREKYLATVKPMAAQNVTTLTVLRTISEADQCAIWFEMGTPNGVVQVCDWVETERQMIKCITSFYDPTDLPNNGTYE